MLQNTKKCLITYVISILLTSTHLISAQKTGTFIATFPTTVIAGTPAQFCIRFQNLDDQDISLSISDNEPHVFDEIKQVLEAADRPEETCIDIDIYSNSKDVSYDKWINVHGEGLGYLSYTFNDSKMFQVRQKSDFDLIETDKPVYKPGQTVRIRVLSLDGYLKPVSKNFSEIFIEDSSMSRVSQWIDVESENGLIDLEMPLSDEPNLGKWTVNVVENKDNINTVTFEVKKYVLPKFETSIDHFPTVRFDENKIDVTVCGSYSYGKGVHGTYQLKAFTSKYTYSYYRSSPKEYKKVEKVSEDVKGCHTFEVNMSDLGFGENNYISSIDLQASVTESNTGIVINSSSTVPVTRDSMKIEVPEIPYYKPGFPIDFKIVVKSIRNELLANEILSIALETHGREFHKVKAISDENGIIVARFDPNECELCNAEKDIYKKKPGSLKLTVRPINFKVDESVPYYKQLHNPQVIKYINPWISKNNSYIQLFKINQSLNKLTCNQNAMLKVKLRTGEELTETDRIYFRFHSLSKIVNSGHFDVNSNGGVFSRVLTKVSLNDMQKRNLELLNADDNEIKHIDSKSRRFLYNDAGKPIATTQVNQTEFYEYTFDFEFQVTSEMSSGLKILVYKIEDTEIISDSISLTVEKCLENSVEILLNKISVAVKNKVTIGVKTEPLSLCAISAIDKSVTFMGKRNEIKLEKVFDQLRNHFQADYDHSNNYETDNDCDNYWEPYPYPIPRPMPRPMPIPELIPVINPITDEETTTESADTASRHKRSIYYPGWGSSTYDATKPFRDSSILYLSDMKVHKECRLRYDYRRKFKTLGRAGALSISPDYEMAEMVMDSASMPMMNSVSQTSVSQTSIKQTVRTFFPETWIWDIQVSNKNGLIKKVVKVPDSITDWLIDSYCVSEKSGLGIAKTNTLKVFQSIFISTALPYSVIRGEQFPVKATVFNYAKTCIPIQVDLLADKTFNILKTSTKTDKYCLCPDEKVTDEFHLEARKTEMNNGLRVAVRVTSINETNICDNEGKEVSKFFKFRDIESKYVLVEPEGIPKEHVQSSFFVFKSEETLSNQTLEFVLPENVVPESTRIYLTATGDAMGSVLNNLDKLVQQPTGCGEQNMVKFAPIVSVVEYLRGTNQISDEMDALTKNYLKIGYQRQLTYRHKDYSFSAFGPSSYSNKTGGTWLTAFVLRCLADCKGSEQVEINLEDLLGSFNLLLSRQDEDGKFRQEGAKLYSSALAGGLKKDQSLGLSAYVLVSLIKTANVIKRDTKWMSEPIDEQRIKDEEKIELAFLYLKESIESILPNTDTYSLALTLYAYKLHNYDAEFAEILETELDKRAITESGQTHWSETAEESSTSKSANVEITSYVLLAKLFDASDKQKLSMIMAIAKWVNSQRNSFGGFYSTQDTVVALDALSKFANIFYMKNIQIKANYMFNEDFNSLNTLSIKNENRLLIQKVKLNDLKEPGLNTVTFNLEGYGTALFQFVVKYNLMDEFKEEDAQTDFEFSIFSSESKCDYTKLTINARYTGEKETSSMALVSIKLPSGWYAVEETIGNLKQSVALRRFETNENQIALYFDEIGKKGIEFQIEALKKFQIDNRKPGLISVYDYYESSDQSITQPFEIDEICDDDE